MNIKWQNTQCKHACCSMYAGGLDYVCVHLNVLSTAQHYSRVTHFPFAEVLKQLTKTHTSTWHVMTQLQTQKSQSFWHHWHQTWRKGSRGSAFWMSVRLECYDRGDVCLGKTTSSQSSQRSQDFHLAKIFNLGGNNRILWNYLNKPCSDVLMEAARVKYPCCVCRIIKTISKDVLNQRVDGHSHRDWMLALRFSWSASIVLLFWNPSQAHVCMYWVCETKSQVCQWSSVSVKLVPFALSSKKNSSLPEI